MTTDVLALREALLRDIHTTFCERSAVAMRKYTPQVTAHQVEALVSDRLDALIAAVRAETLAGPGVVDECCDLYPFCTHGYPATPPTPARERGWARDCYCNAEYPGCTDPDCSCSHHALPTPVLTAARCGYLIRMLGLTPFICNRAEDDALHRSRTHPDAHSFLATPDPERLLAAIEAQAIGEVEA